MTTNKKTGICGLSDALYPLASSNRGLVLISRASPNPTLWLQTSRVSASMKRVDMFKIFLGEDEEKLDKIFSFQEG